MKIEFDPEKNARNIELRGISFEEAARFEWESAVLIADTRQDYDEPRYRAFGLIGNRLHALVFTPREGAIRIISLRKANRREVLRYENQTHPEHIDKENPEWTEEDFQEARPAGELLPKLVGPKAAAEALKSRGRPRAAQTKTHLNIRVDADVLEAFKATGRGWQTRINRALREWIEERESRKSQHT